MFEKEIERLGQETIERLPVGRESYTLDELQSANIHPAVVQYISAELDFLAARDLRAIVAQSAFNYADPEVKPYLDKITSIFKRKKKFSTAEISRYARQALTLNLHFLLKPNRTIRKFLFGKESERHADDIKLLLNYFAYYKYIKKIVLTVFDLKKKVKLGKYEFGELLENMQKELLQTQFTVVIENAVDAMKNYFAFYQEGKGSIPRPAVEMLLKERNLHRYVDKLAQQYPPAEYVLLEPAAIKKVIFGPEVSSEESIAEDFISLDKKKAEKKDDTATGEQPVFEKPFDPEVTGELAETLAAGNKGEKETIIEEDPEKETEVSLQEEEPVDKALNEESNVREDIDEVENALMKEEKEDDDGTGFVQIDRDDAPSSDSVVRSNKEGDVIEYESFEDFLKRSSDGKAGEIENDLLKTQDEIGSREIEKEQPVKRSGRKDNLQFEKTKYMEKFKLSNEKAEELKRAIQVSEESNDEEIDRKRFEDEEVRQETTEHIEKLAEPEQKKRKKKNRDIFSIFSTAETEKITSLVFNEDQMDFVNTLERIADCNSFKEAHSILNSVINASEISTKHKTAQLLFDRLAEWYEVE